MQNFLLVDDDPDVLETVSKMLTRAGYQAFAANNEGDAISLLHERNDIHAALIDFWLGDRPSLGLLEAIKEIQSELPVVVMSGGNMVEPLEVVHSVSALSGAADFLQKPFGRAELLDVIRNLSDR